MADEAKPCDGDIEYTVKGKIDERRKGVFCGVDLEKKLGAVVYVTSVEIIAHVNCYSVCEVVCLIQSVDRLKELAAKSVSEAASCLTEAIGKRFTVHIEEKLRFTGFLSAVECFCTKDTSKKMSPLLDRAMKMRGSAISASDSTLEEKEDRTYAVKLTLLSSLQRLETIWNPASATGTRKSWVDSGKKKPKEGEEEGAGIALSPDGSPELSVRDVIESLLAMVDDVVFKPGEDDLDIGDIPIAYSLWPHYMNAFEYLVMLTEASGSFFHIDQNDRVIFGSAELTMLIGDSVIRSDAHESFTFINSASAYSHGAHSDFLSSDYHIGLKTTRFVEGNVNTVPGIGADNSPRKNYEQKRFSRYMDVVAGTTDASAVAAVRRMIGAETRRLGSLTVEYYDNEENAALTEAVLEDWCDLAPKGLSTKFGLISYRYIVGGMKGIPFAAKMFLKAGQLAPEVELKEGGDGPSGGEGQPGGDDEPKPGDDRRLTYMLSPDPEGKEEKPSGAGKNNDGEAGPDFGEPEVEVEAPEVNGELPGDDKGGLEKGDGDGDDEYGDGDFENLDGKDGGKESENGQQPEGGAEGNKAGSEEKNPEQEKADGKSDDNKLVGKSGDNKNDESKSEKPEEYSGDFEDNKSQKSDDDKNDNNDKSDNNVNQDGKADEKEPEKAPENNEVKNEAGGNEKADNSDKQSQKSQDEKANDNDKHSQSDKQSQKEEANSDKQSQNDKQQQNDKQSQNKEQSQAKASEKEQAQDKASEKESVKSQDKKAGNSEEQAQDKASEKEQSQDKKVGNSEEQSQKKASGNEQANNEQVNNDPPKMTPEELKEQEMLMADIEDNKNEPPQMNIEQDNEQKQIESDINENPIEPRNEQERKMAENERIKKEIAEEDRQARAKARNEYQAEMERQGHEIYYDEQGRAIEYDKEGNPVGRARLFDDPDYKGLE